MKRNKLIPVFLMSLVLLLSTTAQSFARVRIIIRPWWPKAVVVVPALPRRPVPPPRPRKIPSDIGFLDLNVRPGDAALYVDGVYRGVASSFSGSPHCLSLVNGKHSISLRREGYRTETVIVRVLPHKVIELDLTLNLAAKGKDETSTYQLDLKKTGSLTFQIEPPDSSVYIDDTFYGVASQFTESEGSIVLRAGEHKLEIIRPGYVTHATTVEISSNKDKELHVTLEKEAEGDQ